MTVASERTIVLKGKGHYTEGILDSVGNPGMHVLMAADGHWDKSPAAIAELVKQNLFLLREDQLRGNTVDTAYAISDIGLLYQPIAGDNVLLFVKSGQNIAVGDFIVPEGGGTGLFIEAAGTEAKYFAQALMSSGGALGANGLIKCRWLG